MAETRSPIELVALTGGAMNLRLPRGRLGGVTANEVQRILVDESGLHPTPDISLRRNK
jgi:hypothetical protein